MQLIDSQRVASVEAHIEQCLQQKDTLSELYGERTARWYQIAARNATIEAIRQKFKRILVKKPTGAGKTMTSGMIFASEELREVLEIEGDRKIRLLLLCHTKRLLSQGEKEYAKANNIEVIPQSAFSTIPQEVIDEGFDIVLIDEAHHEAMQSIQYQLEQIAKCPIIGLTATPDRPDGCLIKFDIIIEPISREQAVREGWLAETEIFSFVDRTGKNKAPFVTEIIEKFHHKMDKAMVFLKTRAEVKAVTDNLLLLNISAVNCSELTGAQLDDALDRFSQGEVQFLVDCKKINEGVDVAGCTDIICGRQFGSYTQLNQVIGRGARPDSDCRVWELINPLSDRNLDTTVIVGEPKAHHLYFKRHGEWYFRDFDYTNGLIENTNVISMGKANQRFANAS